MQRGTGDAAMVGLGAFPGDDLDDTSTVVVLPGDTPLLQPATIDALVSEHESNEYAATLITSELTDPTGYGRIVRAPSKTGPGRVLRIVEQRDATPEERVIREVNTSMYAFRRDLLGPALRHLSPDNRAGRVLPHRCRRCAGRDGAPHRQRGRSRRGDARGQRSLAARTCRA